MTEPRPIDLCCSTCLTKKPRPGLGFPCSSCDDPDPTWAPYGELQQLQKLQKKAPSGGSDASQTSSLDQGRRPWETSEHRDGCSDEDQAPNGSKRAEQAELAELQGPDSFDPYRGLAVPPCAEGEILHLCCDSCGWIHVQPLSCKRRTCPSCCHTKYKEMLKRYRPLARDSTYLKMLTLTLKRGSHPGRMVAWILECFKHLRRREIFKHQEGGAYFLEAKPPGEDGEGWNVHLHVLVDGPYMPQEVLSDEWLDLTRSSMIVDIRRVSPKGGLGYALGYCLKGSKVKAVWEDQPEDVREAWENAVKGRRLIQTFGSWHGAAEDPPVLTCPACQASSWYIIEYLGEGGQKIADHLGLHLFCLPSHKRTPPQRELSSFA